MNNGVIEEPIPLATWNKNCVKSGLIFALINSGIISGDIKVHFCKLLGINIVIKIIKINARTIKGNPEKFNTTNKLIYLVVITTPILVQSIIPDNIDIKTIIANK